MSFTRFALSISPIWLSRYQLILRTMMIPEQENKEYHPLVPLTYGLKSPESRRQYPRRLKVFLDFLEIQGSLIEQAREFWLTAKNIPRWVEDKLMKFVGFQKERAIRGEISEIRLY